MDVSTSSSSLAGQLDPPDEKWMRNLRVRIGQSLAPQVAEAKKALALKLAETEDDDLVTRADLNAEFEDVMDNFRKQAQDELDTHVRGELLQRRYVADQKLNPEEMSQLQRYQQTLYDHVAKGSPDSERTRTSSNEPRQGARVPAVPMVRASSGGSTTSVSASRDTSVLANIRPYTVEAPEPARRRNNSVASTSSLEQQLWSPSRKRSGSNSGNHPTISVAGAIFIPDASNERDRWTPLTPPDEPVVRTSRSVSSTLLGASSASGQSAIRGTSRESGWKGGVSSEAQPKRQTSRTWTAAVNDDGFTYIIPGTTPTSELEEGFVDAAPVEAENASENKRGKRASRANKTRTTPGSPSMIGPSLLVPPHASPSQSVTLLEARGTPTGSPNAFNIIDLSAPTQPLPSRTPAYAPSSQSLGRKGSTSMARRFGRPGDLGLFDTSTSGAAPSLLDIGPPPATSIESLMAGNLAPPGSSAPTGSNNTSTSSALASSRPRDSKRSLPAAPSSTQPRPLSFEPSNGDAVGTSPSGSSPSTKAAIEHRRTLPLSSSPRNGVWITSSDTPNQHVSVAKPRRSSGSSFQQPDEAPLSNSARFRRGSASSMNGPVAMDDSTSSARSVPLLRPRRSANLRDDHDGVGVSPRTRQWFGPEPIPEDSKLELPAQAEPSTRDREGGGTSMSRNGSLRARASRDYLRSGPDLHSFNSTSQRRAGPLDDEFSDDESLLERRSMSIRSVDFDEIMRRDAEATRREEDLKLKVKEAEAREVEMEAAKAQLAEREKVFKQKEEEVRMLKEEAAQHVVQVRRREEEVMRREEATYKELEIARQEKEEARRNEEEAKEREAEARKECEGARAMEADAKRIASEARKASDAAKRKEEQIKRKEEATRKKEEELRRKEEEARQQIKRAEEDAQRQVEAAQRDAQRKEDELRRREEDLTRREEDLARREQLQRREKELFEREQQLRSREEQQRQARRQMVDAVRQDHSPQSEGDELVDQYVDTHGSRESPPLTPPAVPTSHEFDESLIDDEPLLAPPPAPVLPGAPTIFEALRDPVTPIERMRPESPLADDERSPHYRSRGATKTRKREDKQDRRTREENRRLQEEEEERMRLEEEERRMLAEEGEHRDFNNASPPPEHTYHAQWQHDGVNPGEGEDAHAAKLRFEEDMQYQHALEQEAQMQRDEEHRRQEEAARRRQLEEQAKDDERYAQQLYDEEQRHRRSEVERQRKQQHQDAIKRAQEEEAAHAEQSRRAQDADRSRRDAPMERERQDDPRWREDRYRQDSAPVYPAAPSMSLAQSTSFTNAVPIPGHRSTSSSSQWSGAGNPSAAWPSSTKTPSTSARPSYPATGISPGTASQRSMGASAQPAGPAPFATSAPRNAPLSEADWARLQAEQAKKQAEQFKREQERLVYEKQSMSAKAHTKESLAYHFQQHQLQWERIRTANKAGFNTFPWPLLHMPTGPDSFTADTVGRYVLSDQYPAEASKSNKDRVKENIRRWHPDRFDTQFLPKVNEDEREKVKECADAVVRALSELLARVNAPVFFDD